MHNLQERLKATKAGVIYALLTVAETECTSPFKIGKKMLVFKGGRTIGTIDGEKLNVKQWRHWQASQRSNTQTK
jgi:xanthine dehydrogenase accessory factor